MKEPAVTDSSCLIVLERVDQLELLPALFHPLLASPTVRDEFSSQPEWLQVQAPSNTALVNVLRLIMGEGEAEAIALAIERQYLLILDDRKARTWAKRLGIRLIGTAGILVRAKRAGLLGAVRPVLEDMEVAGFRMSPQLKQEVLRLAGE